MASTFAERDEQEYVLVAFGRLPVRWQPNILRDRVDVMDIMGKMNDISRAASTAPRGPQNNDPNRNRDISKHQAAQQPCDGIRWTYGCSCLDNKITPQRTGGTVLPWSFTTSRPGQDQDRQKGAEEAARDVQEPPVSSSVLTPSREMIQILQVPCSTCRGQAAFSRSENTGLRNRRVPLWAGSV
jgi:hypothetical protein